MRYILLVVSLRYSFENSADILDAISARLPGGSSLVIRFEKMVAYLIPPVDPVLARVVARVRAPLNRAADWHAFGLSGDSISMNGSIDPVETWLDAYRPTAAREKRIKSQAVAPSQRRQLRMPESV